MLKNAYEASIGFASFPGIAVLGSTTKNRAGAYMNTRSCLLHSLAATGLLIGGGSTLPGQDAKSASTTPIVETSACKIRGLFQNKVYTLKGTHCIRYCFLTVGV